MGSLAALRTGAGLVTAAVARSIQQTVALVTPELMTTALEEVEGGALAVSEPSHSWSLATLTLLQLAYAPSHDAVPA